MNDCSNLQEAVIEINPTQTIYTGLVVVRRYLCLQLLPKVRNT